MGRPSPIVFGSNPFHSLRKRLTRGLEVKSSTREVSRGQSLEASVTIAKGAKLGAVQVGLFCTEAYAVEMQDTDGGTSQGTSWATAYEAWVPLAETPGVQTVRLDVPADGPYTYDGEILSFRWEVVARGVRKRRLDARAICLIVVRP